MDNINIKEEKNEVLDFDPLSLIENNISDIICIHNPDGCYRYVTGAIEKILGYTSETLKGTSSYDYFHPDDIEGVRHYHAQALAGRTGETRIEYRFRKKDGSYCWLQTQTTPVFDSEGIVTKLLTVSRDISDRKLAEQSLQESEIRIREFAEAVPDYSFIFDEDGLYIEVFGNENLLSKPKEQYQGSSIYQILQEEDATFVLDEVQQAILSGEKRSCIREIRMGLEKRFISGHAVPLNYEVNGKKTVAIIATDITEQRRMERMLQVTYELRRRSDFINDILSGRASDENITYLSSKIGFDLNVPIFACMFLSNKIHFNQVDLQGEKLNSVQKSKDAMIDALRDIPNSVAWDCREGIGVLCQTKFDADEWIYNKQLASHIRETLLKHDASIVVSVGVSDVHTGIQGLKNSWRQGTNAAIAARCQVIEGMDIVHYREAGIFQFIPELLGKDAAKEYIERNIGKLIAYDREKKMNYVSTLEELLRGSSVRETADKQFLHPKTVVFRQKRIEKILNVNLGASHTRLALGVAIQLHKINNI